MCFLSDKPPLRYLPGNFVESYYVFYPVERNCSVCSDLEVNKQPVHVCVCACLGVCLLVSCGKTNAFQYIPFGSASVGIQTTHVMYFNGFLQLVKCSNVDVCS